MLRLILLHYVLPFVLPTIIYVIWLMIAGRIDKTRPGQHLRELPWAWLVGAGSLLMVAGLVVAALVTDGGTDSVYVPAEYRDGKLVPGHFDPRPRP